jgi:hypothetical protein
VSDGIRTRDRGDHNPTDLGTTALASATTRPSAKAIGLPPVVRDPDRPEAAEVTVIVGDGWQRRGLGTVPLNVITERAREEGIRTFSARCRPAIAG